MIRTALPGALALGLMACAAQAQLIDRSGHYMAFVGTTFIGTMSAPGTASGAPTTAEAGGPVTASQLKLRGDFNLTLSGSWSGSCELDRSFDAGATWSQIGALGTGFSWTGPTSETLSEPEYGVLYRLYCPTLSGTLAFRISQ